VHPSDLAVALTALGATVVTLASDGGRRRRVEDLHRLPGYEPQHDTVLEHGELITALELEPSATARRSTYVKVRDRASYAFALVSVAVGVDVDEDLTVRDVRIAWGGAAHKPWRAERAETALRGTTLTEERVRAAVDQELTSAETSEGTAYKVPLLRNTTALAFRRLVPGLEEER